MKSLSKRKKRDSYTATMSSTKNALKQTRRRVKKQLLSLLCKTKKSIKRATIKVNTTVAKKIRSLTKRRS
jgi:uncharacterized protein YdaL